MASVSPRRDFRGLYYRAKDFLWKNVLVPVLIFAYLSPMFFAGIYYNFIPPGDERLANIVATYYFLLVFCVVIYAFTLCGIILSTIVLLANTSELLEELSLESQRRKVLAISARILKILLLFFGLLILSFLFFWNTMLFLWILKGLSRLVPRLPC